MKPEHDLARKSAQPERSAIAANPDSAVLPIQTVQATATSPERGPGRPVSYSVNENAALRAALRNYRARLRCSQAEVGNRLGVGQQAASALLRNGGFSRPTADRLAALLGFDCADALLETNRASRRVAITHSHPIGEWRLFGRRP